MSAGRNLRAQPVDEPSRGDDRVVRGETKFMACDVMHRASTGTMNSKPTHYVYVYPRPSAFMFFYVDTDLAIDPSPI
jgi:hypothetical protein